MGCTKYKPFLGSSLMHFKCDSSEIRTLTSRIFHVMLFESCIFELGYQKNQKLFCPVLSISIRKYAFTG